MLRSMSSHQFTEWQAYFNLEPFGQDRLLHAICLVAATIANANRDPAKRKKPFEASDFLKLLPRYLDNEDSLPNAVGDQPEEPRQSVDQMLAMAQALHVGFGGTPPGGQ